MTIDTTKPLQLTDGTPVEFMRYASNGDIYVDIPAIPYGPRGTSTDRVFRPSGSHWFGKLPDLQNVPESTFDPTKPVQTRDGRPARIICTDAGLDNGYEIIAVVEGEAETYQPNGLFFGQSLERQEASRDLVNIPEETVEYMNVYEPGRFPCLGDVVGEKRSKAEADQAAAADRLACLKVTSVNGKRTSVEIA